MLYGKMMTIYLDEMEELLEKYSRDPNKSNMGEEKLKVLLNSFDNDWMAFRRKWIKKLGSNSEAVAVAKIKKDKKGLRHLIIKSEVIDAPVLDLMVAEEVPQNTNPSVPA